MPNSGDRFPGYSRDPYPSKGVNPDSPFGGRDEPAATSDEGTAGLIGLLKRVLARLTELLPQRNNRLAVDAEFPAVGKVDDAAASTDAGSATVISLLKRVLTRLTTLLPQTVSNKLAVEADVLVLGTTADAAATTDTETATAIALLKRVLTRLTTLLPQANTSRLAVDSLSSDAVEVSGTPASAMNANVFSINCSNYRYASVQLSVNSFLGTAQFQGSNDGTAWTPIPMEQKNILSHVTNFNSAVLVGGNLSFKFFRLRIVSYTTGSISALALLYNQPPLNLMRYIGNTPTVNVGNTISINNSTFNVQGFTGQGGAIGNPSPLILGANTKNVVTTPFGNDQVVRLIATTTGVLVTFPYAPPENYSQFVSGLISTTTDVVLFTAAGASIRNYLISLNVCNTSATSTLIEIKDGATVIGRFFAPANSNQAIPLSGFLKGTANTALSAACVTAGASVYITAVGFRAP